MRFDSSCAGPHCSLVDLDNGEFRITIPGAPEISKITFFVNLDPAVAASVQLAGAAFDFRRFRSCFGSVAAADASGCQQADLDGDSVIGSADFNAIRAQWQAAQAGVRDPLDPLFAGSEFSVAGLYGSASLEPMPSLFLPGSSLDDQLRSGVAHAPEPAAPVVFASSLIAVSYLLRRRRSG